MDGLTDSGNIANLFKDKYEALYNSVPTEPQELQDLTNKIAHGCSLQQVIQMNITDEIIMMCIKKLNKNKHDGNVGFNSNHLIYG